MFDLKDLWREKKKKTQGQKLVLMQVLLERELREYSLGHELHSLKYGTSKIFIPHTFTQGEMTYIKKSY